MFMHTNSISAMNSIAPSYLHSIGGASNHVPHHFNSHHHSNPHSSSNFSSPSYPLSLQQPSFDHNQYSGMHQNNHASSTYSNMLSIDESCNSSGYSSLSSSSPVSTSSSSPDAKFNFLPNNQPNYLNYINQNCSFPTSNQNYLQNNLNFNLQQQFNTFNNMTKTQYEEDDYMLREDEEDDISVSHYDMKMMHYNPGCEPLPGKTRTRDKYRIVYTENQRRELENEYVANKYITIARKSEISKKLQLSERQIKIWFQNRRAKDRKQITKKHHEF